MARKRALVVDDSKSARVILSRMLEKYDIEVDMADAAEQAIEYLKNNRPDAIFMDHLMPGMDGLQALQAIKGNAQTATIPIMMYTSQEGELYLGQARALGAMGVMPKQVRPVDVSKVLHELHLLPERRDTEELGLTPAEQDNGTPVERPPAAKPAGTAAIDWGRRVESAVKDQAVDIRRFIVASLDSFATRIVGDVRDAMPIQTGAPLVPSPVRPARRSPWPWAAAVAASVLVAAAFAVNWFMTRNELSRVRADMAGLTAANSELQRSRLDLSAAIKDLSAALAAANANIGPAPSGAFASSFGGTSATAAAAAPRVERVPYGEIPFDHSRLEILRDLLLKLEAQGFHGVVKVSNLAGQFCLSGNGTDGYAPAAPNLPVSRCDLVGNPFEESLTGQQRQSLAFANLIAGVHQRTAGAISVSLDSAPNPRAAAAYPARSDSLTAGEWNRAAAANNRVEFSLEPGAAGANP
jgi:CheY-like chemotaxis protein